MNKQDIINAYVTIRKENNTIPDDVLYFMKTVAINQLDSEIKPCHKGMTEEKLYNLVDVIGNHYFSTNRSDAEKNILRLLKDVILDQSTYVRDRCIRSNDINSPTIMSDIEAELNGL